MSVHVELNTLYSCWRIDYRLPTITTAPQFATILKLQYKLRHFMNHDSQSTLHSPYLLEHRHVTSPTGIAQGQLPLSCHWDQISAVCTFQNGWSCH